MASPDFYQQDGPGIALAVERLKELEAELVHAFLRWEELEKLGLNNDR
jgi:hypothetical protein